MNPKHIIIQAGGLGTRLGKLTRNKPKSLVPVNNRPVLFHAFELFPNAHFIIIGDYKYFVLESYLRNFAKVDYTLVHAVGKGNASGINVALEHVPEEAPFLLMWSDVLLSKNIDFCKLPVGNYIGLTSRYPCSWRMVDGVLEKKSGGSQGLAGVFLFCNKAALNGLPMEGSLALWLSNSGLKLNPLDILDSHDVGNLTAIKEIDSGENRCRPYNSIEFEGDRVKKTTLTADGQKLLVREIIWYRTLKAYGFPHIPEIYSYEPLIMSRINGSNVFNVPLDEEGRRCTLKHMVDSLNLLHSYGSRPVDIPSLYMEYYEKTLTRLDGVKTTIPFSDKPYITINGKQCRNVLFFRQQFCSLIEACLFDAEFVPIHGDATLTNTMIDGDDNIFFIDARGYFGNYEVYGDIYYDWAKLYYSINGNFDNFNIKAFELEVKETEVAYSIQSAGWEGLTGYFISLIPNCNMEKIKLIHAIIWLSLASHCWEDYDSLCAAFYIGTRLLEDCWNEAD